MCGTAGQWPCWLNIVARYRMQALHEFRRQGKSLLFVTNNASKSRAAYVKRFAGLGLEGITEQHIVSSSYAAAAYHKPIGFKKSRTRDGMSPSAVVALDTERSGKRISNQDDEVRELLEVAEEEADS